MIVGLLWKGWLGFMGKSLIRRYMGLIWEEFNKEKVCTIRKYSINKKMDNYNKHNYKSEILYVVSKI